MKQRPPIVVFSDADSVLRYPRTHTRTAAAKALKRLEGAEVPVILCSKYTRAEIEGIQQDAWNSPSVRQ